MRAKRLLMVLAIAAIAAFATAGVGIAQYPAYPGTPSSPSPKPATPASIGIGGTSAADYAFQPRTERVKAGQKVSWSWQSNAPHNITFTKGGKHSATAPSGAYSFRFKTPGVYHYYCSIHGFTGKIVVK